MDKISRSRHIRGVALPRVQPIIPTWRKEPFDDPEWLFEFKYDGFRGLCYLEPGRCRFISRNGNMLSRFDALADQVGRLLDVDEAIIDGEVIAVDESGRPQFYELLRVPRSASYVAFDILWADGTDLRSSPLSDRRKRLQAILPEGSPIVSEALSVAGRGRELFELMREHDLEGIVAKRLDDPYDPRVRWLKIKNPDYSQKEGRGDLFNRSWQATRAFARLAGEIKHLGTLSERQPPDPLPTFGPVYRDPWNDRIFQNGIIRFWLGCGSTYQGRRPIYSAATGARGPLPPMNSTPAIF